MRILAQGRSTDPLRAGFVTQSKVGDIDVWRQIPYDATNCATKEIVLTTIGVTTTELYGLDLKLKLFGFLVQT